MFFFCYLLLLYTLKYQGSDGNILQANQVTGSLSDNFADANTEPGYWRDGDK